MTDGFSENRSAEGSPMKLHGLSPDRYGSTAFKNLSYTPEKLYDNFIYRQVTVTKKIQTEKNRIRELESLNSLLEEKVRHLFQENTTVRQSFELQIEMYKKMLREQEQEARKVIRNLQSEYTLQIQKILTSHEQDSKVAQAQKQEYERRIQELSTRIDELQGHTHHGNNSIADLNSKLRLTQQKLSSTEDKMGRSQQLSRQNIDRLNRQLTALNGRMMQDSTTFKQQMDSFHTEKIREIEALKRLHQTQLQKLQNKRDAQMHSKSLELKDIKLTFQGQGRRLQQIINNKDRANQVLTQQLKRQKQRTVALMRNYDMEINQLVVEKEHILKDLELLSDEKNSMGRELNELILLFQGERGRNSIVVNGLQGQIGKKNLQLAAENWRLIRTAQQYEKQLVLTSHNANTIQKNLYLERSQQIRRLLLQIKNLKEVLLQSSREMEKCKQQFLHQQAQRQQLIMINYECQQQAIRLKAIIAQQDLELRLRHY